jgi:predicted SAM-dependent methyltransferase
MKQKIKTIGAKIKRFFIRPPLPDLEEKIINLHLGCGTINHPKFINIDGLPDAHVHYIRPIENLSIFDDNSVDLIYASHCLEHFKYNCVSSVLVEWFRVLKKSGILRLSVPDFDLLLDIYKKNGNNINTIIEQLMGGQNHKYNFHYTAFNKSNLEALLLKTGFETVREWQPGSCEYTTFDDFSTYKKNINGELYPVSLNLEAVK